MKREMYTGKSIRLALLAVCAALGGCGGEYVLTLPDQVAAAGEQSPVVLRLQRSEIYTLALPVKEAPLELRIGDGPMRAAYTDELGYAGTLLQAPEAPGEHPLRVFYQDFEGETFDAQGRTFVLDPSRRIIAVDADALPPSWADGAPAARAAVAKIAADTNVVYLTRRDVSDHAGLHVGLESEGYPAGPVLLWEREYWHVVREGEYGVPRIRVETRLVSQLAELRKRFPTLDAGICAGPVAARAFVDAGLECVFVGPAPAPEGAAARESWEDLGARGL